MTNLDDINKLFDFQFVGGDDEFIDVGFEAPDGTVQNEEGEIEEALSKPDATFLSVFGKHITDRVALKGYHRCRSDAPRPSIATRAASDVYEFAHALKHYSYHSKAEGLNGRPEPEAVAQVVADADDFLTAYKLETGLGMGGPIFSQHDRIKVETRGVKALRRQARELVENDVFRMSERTRGWLEDARNAERDRKGAERGREKASVDKVRQRQRVR